jgi:putative transposase
MTQFAGVSRLVWNLALEQRRNHWHQFKQATGKRLNYFAQAAELTALRAEFDFIRAVPQVLQQRALMNLQKAFENAWSGRKSYPQPKRKGVHESFSFGVRDISVANINHRWGSVRIPKLGWIKFRKSRAIDGKILDATITYTALGWQISFNCAIDRNPNNPGGSVGIDMGVKIPLMLSDGQSFDLPPAIASHEQKLRQAQRVAARRKKGSVRWAKAMRRAAALSARQARCRKHWAHETTTKIARQYGTVVIERLNTQSMTRSAKGTLAVPGKSVSAKRSTNREIHNVGWGNLKRMLTYKAYNLILVDPRYTSQTCAVCGHAARNNRKSQAIFSCSVCGNKDNCDQNAAKVILSRGSTPGVEVADYGSDEARTLQVA